MADQFGTREIRGRWFAGISRHKVLDGINITWEFESGHIQYHEQSPFHNFAERMQ
jgi:hypothetical protein